MKGVNIKLGFFPTMFLIVLLIAKDYYALISLFAVVVHEVGHILAARVFKIKLSEFSFELLGARLKISEGIYSYTQEIFLCLAGPLFNFLSVLIVIIFFNSKASESFILLSLCYGLLNLLPIRSFDGGRIFESLLLLFIPITIAEKILDLASFIFLFSLWCISVYFLLIYSSSLSLFVFSASLFSNLFISGENTRFS